MATNPQHVKYQVIAGPHVTATMLQEAAELFSNHYGIWGPRASEKVGAFAKSGRRIKMSPGRLRAECLPDNAIDQCTYVRVEFDGVLAGNIFACRWKVDGKVVVWVTQLVVATEFRCQRVATRLLELLRDSEVWAFGVMNSHAHTCMAAVNAFGTMANVNMELTQHHAAKVINASPINYVKGAKLHGSLFGNGDDGTVSSADTNFYVDPDEPLKALSSVRESGVEWPFGDRAEGHEFLVIVKPPSRAHVHSRSAFGL
ncbi:MAG: hypothetical protein Q9162_005203 [Coniocarpon cinnabarinum]